MNTHKLSLLFICTFQLCNLFSEQTETTPLIDQSGNSSDITYQTSFDAITGAGTIQAIDTATGLSIGFVQYTASVDRKSINTLHVEPSYRQRGIATQLLNRALQHIAQIPAAVTEINFTASPFGIACMKLDTLIKFYQKRGAILIHNYGSWAAMKFIPQTT